MWSHVYVAGKCFYLFSAERPPASSRCCSPQGVITLLINYSLLGVVYARFSRPAKRAGTLRFSRNMVLYEVSGAPQRARQAPLVVLLVRLCSKR